MKGCGLQPPSSPSPNRQFLAAQRGRKPAHAVGWHTPPSHAGGEPILPEKSFFFICFVSLKLRKGAVSQARIRPFVFQPPRPGISFLFVLLGAAMTFSVLLASG